MPRALVGVLRTRDASPRAERSYDAAGRLAHETRPHAPGDATQGIIDYAYNDAGELTSITYPNHKPDGSSTTAVYKYEQGNVASFTSELNASLDGPHAASVVRVTDPDQDHETRFYDLSGKLVTSVDALGTAVQYKYHPFDDLTEINGAGSDIQLSYDDIGRRLSLADPDRGTHQFAYTGFDELHEHVTPDHGTETFDYDGFGRVTTLTNNDGVRRWTYDVGAHAIGRMSSETVEGDGIATVTNSVTYAYDDHGRPWTSTHQVQAHDYVVGFHYKGDGRIAGVDYPSIGDSEFNVAYDYDQETGIHTKVRDADHDRTFWELKEATQGYLPHVEAIGPVVTTTKDYYPLSGLLKSIKSAANGTDGRGKPGRGGRGHRRVAGYQGIYLGGCGYHPDDGRPRRAKP